MIRVLPRDAFNDSNLLKCIGRLVLAIEAGLAPNLRYDYDGEPFDIQQDESDGSTYVSNFQLYTIGGQIVTHRRPLNSLNSFRLYLQCDDYECEAFDDHGNYVATKF